MLTMSGERLRPLFKIFEAAEIGTLISTGAMSYVNGELLPTVLAVGTIVALASWHGYHRLKDRSSYNVVDAELNENDQQTLYIIRTAKQSTKHHKIHDRGPKRGRSEADREARRNII